MPLMLIVEPFAFAAHLSPSGDCDINRDASHMGTIHDPPSTRLDIYYGTALGSIDPYPPLPGRPIEARLGR